MTNEDRMIENEGGSESSGIPPRFSVGLNTESQNSSTSPASSSLFMKFTIVIQFAVIGMLILNMVSNSNMQKEVRNALKEYQNQVNYFDTEISKHRDSIAQYKIEIDSYKNKTIKAEEKADALRKTTEESSEELNALEKEIIEYQSHLTDHVAKVKQYEKDVKELEELKNEWKAMMSKSVQSSMDKITLFTLEQMEKSSGY